MEPAGFAVGLVGLAGLFSTCLEVVERAQTYRSFASDSKGLDLQFNATKVRLENWGRAVGFVNDGRERDRSEDGRPKHHPALDNEQTRRATAEIFNFVQDICESSQSIHGKPHPGMPSNSTQPDDLTGASVPSRARKLAWAMGGKLKRAEQVELLKELVQTLHNLVPSDSIQTEISFVNTWSTEFREIVSRLEARTRREVHAWLRHVPDERYQESLETRLDGTCRWILEHPKFTRWASPDFDSGAKVLWIHGPAGFGKTILCANIVHHMMETSEPPTARFFFASGSRDDPFLAVRSWVSQVVSRHDVAFQYALKHHENDTDPTATRHTIMSVFEGLVRLIPGCTFVVDGLDECTQLEGVINSVVSFLEAVTAAVFGTDTRLLVVSRFLACIQHALRGEDRHRTLSEYKLQSDDVQSDIAAYSRDIIERKLQHKNPTLRLSLSETMAERCEGQFLWLKYQGDALRRGMSKKQLEDTVKNTPTKLERIYDHNWNTITQLDESDRNHAFSILRWAAFATTSLPIAGIAAAILAEESEDFDLDDLCDPIDDDYVDTEIIGLCGPLLEVRLDPSDPSPGRRTIHLPHFTVREYLLGKLPTPGWIRSSELRPSCEKLHHTLLAEICIRYLDSPQTWTQYERHCHLVHYASVNWYHHVQCGIRHEPTLSDILIRFFREENPAWADWQRVIDSVNPPALRRNEGEDETKFIRSPLWWSVRLGLTDLSILLIRAKRFIVDGTAADRAHPVSPFMLAVKNGDTAIVDAFIQEGQDIMCRDKTGSTALGQASLMGRLGVVKLLLEQGVDVNLADNSDETPLINASCNGHTDVASLLLEKGADTEAASTAFGRTAVIAAACYGHGEVLKLLLENGANIEAADRVGGTALYAASCNGHTEVVEILLQQHADTTTTNHDGWTPVNAAANLGHTEVVKLLIENGADITVPDVSGWTPLNSASWAGRAEVVRLLLDNKADLTIANSQGWTPVNAAASFGHAEVVELLVENHADITVPDNLGWTPLNSASSNGHMEVVRFLLDRNADITASTYLGWTPLNSASAKGHVEVVRILLDRRADINVSTSEGWTPLQAASFKGHTKVVALLLERGADITATNNKGGTPALWAAKRGHADTLKLLLEHGADATIPSNSGRSPLSYASQAGHLAVVQVLLSNPPVGINHRNPMRRTALFFASKFGQFEVVKALLDAGANRTIADWARITPQLAAERCGHLKVAGLLSVSGIPAEYLVWCSRPENSLSLFKAMLEDERAYSGPIRYDQPWCDACSRDVFDDSGFACVLCKMAAFYLCSQCYENGTGCLDASHGFWPKKLSRAETK